MTLGPDGSHAETELRKRAAWLLAMLALVAVLLLVLVGLLVRTSGGGGGGSNALASSAPLDTDISSPPSTSTSTAQGRHHRSSGARGSTSGSPSTGDTSPLGSASSGAGSATCPGSAPCTLSGDVGNATAAIDAYRAQHHRDDVPVRVSSAAQSCALSQGKSCSSHWAETQVASADGRAALHQIEQFADLLNPQTSAVEIGWAYDPGSKQYFFSTIRDTGH